MIEVSAIQVRVAQLQEERQQVTARLQELATEAAEGQRLLNAYDGAIGELTRLAQMGPMEQADSAAPEVA